METKLIQDKELYLRNFNVSDLTPEYIQWYADSEVLKFSELRHRKQTLSSCKDFLDARTHAKDLYAAIVLEQETGDVHIGNITAYIDQKNQVADLSILLGNKNYWGRGFGLRAWNLGIQYLFSKNLVQIITAGTMAVNIPMIKLMDKSGMKTFGILPNQFNFEGKRVDGIYVYIKK